MNPAKLSTNDNFFEVLKYAIIALPITFYLVIVQQYALNIPHQDDYDAILYFVTQFSSVHNLGERFSLLMVQHNEHRIFTSRLVYAIYYLITGHVNFKHIIYTNAVILIGIYIAIAAMIRRLLPQNWLIAVFVLGISLFDLDNYENANFAMSGMQNFGVVLLLVLGLTLYKSPRKWALPVAVLVQALVVFTSGNGIIASACIAAYVWISTRQKFPRVVSLITLLLVAPLYYVNYIRVNSTLFALAPAKNLPIFLHTIGAHFGYHSGIVAALVLLTGFIIFLPRERKFAISENAKPLVIIVLFAIGSMATMSVFRGNLPIQNSFSSRYHIYSHLVVAIVFCFFIYKFELRARFNQATSLIVIILLFVYQRNYRIGKNEFVNMNNTIHVEEFDYPNKERAKMITEEACKRGIYCIDKERPANP